MDRLTSLMALGASRRDCPRGQTLAYPSIIRSDEGLIPYGEKKLAMAVPKVLTISLEFTLTERKNKTDRLKAAYQSAVDAAIEAARTELLEDSIESVDTSMSFEYRWIESSQTIHMEVEEELEAAEDD
jgi:hypothetical protein